MVSFPTRWFHSQVGKARDCKSLTSGPNPLGTSTALVAQLDRVFDYESKGQEFESLRGHHLILGHSEVWLSRLPWEQEAVGSNPTVPTILIHYWYSVDASFFLSMEIKPLSRLI